MEGYKRFKRVLEDFVGTNRDVHPFSQTLYCYSWVFDIDVGADRPFTVEFDDNWD